MLTVSFSDRMLTVSFSDRMLTVSLSDRMLTVSLVKDAHKLHLSWQMQRSASEEKWLFLQSPD